MATTDSKQVSLLVGGGIGYGVLYSDALHVGFDRPILLPDSHLCDAVLAATAAPLSRDGHRDAVLLGSYGHELMMYTPSAPSAVGPLASMALRQRVALEAPIYAIHSTRLYVLTATVSLTLGSDSGLPVVAVVTSTAMHLFAPARGELASAILDAAAAWRTGNASQ